MTRYRTVAERLSDAGCQTGAVTANPWTVSDTGFDQGFDVFRTVGNGEESSHNRLSAALDRVGIGGDGWLLRWLDYYDTILEVKRRLSEPYFLWIFLLDPHQPYLAPRAYRTENTALGMYYGNLRFNRSFGYRESLPTHFKERLWRAYRDTVRSIDGFVEALYQDVCSDAPVFVVHADHGEAFQEHGAFGHRPQLYEENIHVPWLVHGVGQSQRVSSPVSLRRLPSVLSLLAREEGETIPKCPTTEFVLARTEEDERRTVRDSGWTLITGGAEWEYVPVKDSDELYSLHSRFEYIAVSNLLLTLRAGHGISQQID